MAEETPIVSPEFKGPIPRPFAGGQQAGFQLAVDAMVRTDERGAIEEANDTCLGVLGYEPKDLIGKNVRLFVPEPHLSAHDGYVERYLNTGHARLMGTSREVEAVRKDGSRLPVLLSLSEYHDSDGARKYLGLIRDLTREKAVQQENARRRDLLEAQFNTFPLPAYYWERSEGGDFILSRINTAALESTGGRASNLIGQTLTALYADEQTVLDDFETVWAERQVVRRIMDYTLRSTGGTTTMLVSYVPIEDRGVMVYTDDISAERAKSRLEQRLRLLAENAPALIAEIAADGTILYSNQETSGRSMAGTSLFDYAPAADHARLRQAIQQSLSSGVAGAVESAWLEPNRNAQHVSIRLSPIPAAADGSRRLAMTAIDITERRRMEVELLAARDNAESANRAKTLFLATMSHEIRTPLNAVLGFADLLQTSELDDEQRAHVEGLLSAGSLLHALLSDVLDISRIEAGGLQLKEMDFATDSLVSQLKATFAGNAAGKGLILSLEARDGLPPLLHADRTRIMQVLVNLVGNAINYSDSGTVRVVLRAEQVRPAECLLVFSVSDEGPGVPSEQQNAIFELFGSGSGGRTGGAGIGLFLARRIARAMQGEVEVTSPVHTSEAGNGHGARFTATFRVSTATTPRPQAPPQRERARARRILLVEDNPLNVMVIGALLSQLGATVETATTGMEAIRRATKRSHDLVLLDLGLPDISGFVVARQLREQGLAVPIVALTASALEEDRREALRLGIDEYQAKPIGRDRLLELLEAWPPGKARGADEISGGDGQ